MYIYREREIYILYIYIDMSSLYIITIHHPGVDMDCAQDTLGDWSLAPRQPLRPFMRWTMLGQLSLGKTMNMPLTHTQTHTHTYI